MKYLPFQSCSLSKKQYILECFIPLLLQQFVIYTLFQYSSTHHTKRNSSRHCLHSISYKQSSVHQHLSFSREVTMQVVKLTPNYKIANPPFSCQENSTSARYKALTPGTPYDNAQTNISPKKASPFQQFYFFKSIIYGTSTIQMTG